MSQAPCLMNLHIGENSAKENSHKHIINKLFFWVLAPSFASICALIVSFTVK
jgi:hypothetical protein